MFCRLTDAEKAALIAFMTIRTPGHSKLAAKADAHDWQGLYDLLTATIDTPPYQVKDIQNVGMMSTSLQNAHFFLFAIDISKDVTDDTKTQLKEAFGTHCYDNIADEINKQLPPERQFTGHDLHQAYDPNDTQSCQMPSVVELIIGKLFAAGQQGIGFIAGFFSQSLPDFMTKTFPHWITDDVGGFFTRIGGAAYSNVQVPGLEIANLSSSGLNETGNQASQGLSQTGSQASSGLSETGNQASHGLNQSGKKIGNIFG